MKKSELKQIIKEEISKILKEASDLPVKITSINGESFYFTKDSFTSPKVNGAEFIKQLIALKATAPDKLASAEMWVHDKETRKTSGADANINVDSSKFSTYFNGIYILDGGLNTNGEWDKTSLSKAKILYYTKNVNDPELKNFKEDGMVRVIIKDNSVNDVIEY